MQIVAIPKMRVMEVKVCIVLSCSNLWVVCGQSVFVGLSEQVIARGAESFPGIEIFSEPAAGTSGPTLEVGSGIQMFLPRMDANEDSPR